MVYGFGNPGRQDDGVGTELVKELEVWVHEKRLEGIVFDSNYQLNIEDAEVISRFENVVFVDASTRDIPDILLVPVTGEMDMSFTTHAASPGYIVKLCGELFGKFPEVHLLHIKGYQWDFQEGLSPGARINLAKALDFMKGFLMEKTKAS